MNEDVDIQAEKKKYLKFRKWVISGVLFSLGFIGIWPMLTDAPTGWIASFWHLFTPWGWPILVGGVLMFWFVIRWQKYHFRCPSQDCDEAIYLADDWVCPIDRSTTKDPWTLWYTIFTGCRKHKHLSPAHKCPNCGHVFKLLENPRTGTSKFSYKPGMQALPSQPSAQPPPEQPRIGEVLPRDSSSGERNFFH